VARSLLLKDGTVNKIKRRISGCNKKNTRTNQPIKKSTDYLTRRHSFFSGKEKEFQLVKYFLLCAIQILLRPKTAYQWILYETHRSQATFHANSTKFISILSSHLHSYLQVACFRMRLPFRCYEEGFFLINAALYSKYDV
jgi:hypothetical protein